MNLGFYDADGNLVGEETFPQSHDAVLTAKLFHPHSEQLERLVEMCVQQAWAKLNARPAVPVDGPPAPPRLQNDGDGD